MRKPAARPSVGSGHAAPSPAIRPEHDQVFGTPETVSWITSGTTRGLTIARAIPPVFESFATLDELDAEDDTLLVEQERAVLRHLADFGGHDWWLGYLDTGAHDVVFPEATRVLMYAEWSYVIVKAGPDEARTWRDSPPELIFPEDSSWLMSMLWDDGWTSVGGPAQLIDDLVADPLVQARAVSLGVDATPPGQTAY